MNVPALPLLDFHRRLGARVEPYRGVDAPAVYSNEDEEYRALRQGCGLFDRSWVTRLEMTGDDRSRYLNGLVTCDVKSLAPGRGTCGFATSQKGRILTDLTVLALDDRLWLEMAPGVEEELTAHLRKYVIIDRVEVRPLDRLPMTLLGPRAGEVVAGLGPPADERHAHREVELCGATVRLVREPERRSSMWTAWVTRDDAEAFLGGLLDHGRELGLRPVGHRAFERWRIEAARPLFGRDFGPDNFPQETGLEGTVSYDKGCYLGQEVVARIHYRGGVQRHLRGLVLGGDTPAAELVGRSIVFDGKEVGTLTSAVDAADGRRLGLAMLHDRAEPGAEVEVGGVAAEVVTLPFA